MKRLTLKEKWGEYVGSCGSDPKNASIMYFIWEQVRQVPKEWVCVIFGHKWVTTKDNHKYCDRCGGF